MELALITEVASLGFAAVDAIGIAFMPILLAQADGLRRALVFLVGSFVALMLVGLTFTTGLGSTIADLNERHSWLEPGVQVFGGVFLVGAGAFMLLRRKSGGSHAPADLMEKLNLPLALLFGFGMVLVIVQSLVDVVFAVAMVEIGAQDLTFVENLLLVWVYTVCALFLQAAIVAAYLAVPHERRDTTMARFTDWLARRGEFWAGVAALLVGTVLLVVAVPHLLQELGG